MASGTATTADVADLPEGWAAARVSDLVEIKYGKGLIEKRRVGGKVPVYGSNGVVGHHNTPLTQGSTIIIGRKGTVGAVHFCPQPCWPIDTTYFIEDLGELDFKFLAHALRSLNLAELDTSSAIPGVNRDDIYARVVSLPPLAEQKRIVAKTETLLARVNAARERLAKVPAILKRFRQSVLTAACSGRLTANWRDSHEIEDAVVAVARLRGARPSSADLDAEFPVKRWRVREMGELASESLPDIPESWVWVHLPELGYMNRGRSRNRPRNAPHLYGGPHPFIQTGDIAQSGGRIWHHRQTYSDEGLAQSRLWPAGTICITIAANIANSAILSYPACFPDSVVGLLPDPELCLAEYAEFFIRTAKEDLSQFAPATAQKNINIAILEEVAVPLPALPEQQEIVRRAEALFALADKIETRVQTATARVEKITQAILAKAFRGELVPTEAALARQECRPYESAAQLLARIRAQREYRGDANEESGRFACPRSRQRRSRSS
jgi:type I restriction enzyme S subunit